MGPELAAQSHQHRRDWHWWDSRYSAHRYLSSPYFNALAQLLNELRGLFAIAGTAPAAIVNQSSSVSCLGSVSNCRARLGLSGRPSSSRVSNSLRMLKSVCRRWFSWTCEKSRTAARVQRPIEHPRP